MCASESERDQNNQQRRSLSPSRESSTPKDSSPATHNSSHYHEEDSLHDHHDHNQDLKDYTSAKDSNSIRSERALGNSSAHQHADIMATSSPRGREQSEEVEERGRSRSREDNLDITDDSFDDISLMGFKTGSKHDSPVKMKKVR
ncbi:hypothetical protein KGF57_002742 [Candida theae]|uniref:Uncharacterized protein n=1 Tax=Candida theae TaxID=1198502 RepID=A0AAD5BEJ6_9ASCO|nr:uncharacterized protein KGF57_002742 [Candida theae]KAI5957934.1 hypothetical protein KGF57_002742 [Candida theae]